MFLQHVADDDPSLSIVRFDSDEILSSSILGSMDFLSPLFRRDNSS